ncbi:AMP-binding protein [Streptomyces albidoflavus]
MCGWSPKCWMCVSGRCGTGWRALRRPAVWGSRNAPGSVSPTRSSKFSPTTRAPANALTSTWCAGRGSGPDARPGARRDPPRDRVTHLQMPPQAWAGLDALTVPDLRTVLTGSDRVPAEFTAAWAGKQVLNGYGSTEATADSTVHLCDLEDGDTSPVGRPIAGTGVYLFDDRVELVPPGTVGEICLGGVGVARGYLGQPGLTAAKFTADPFGDVPGARL